MLEVASTCPVTALLDWVKAAAITTGPLFRTFTLHGQLQENRIDGRDVARIVQRAAKKAGIKADLSGHSLRAGFVTSAAKQKISIDAIARVSRPEDVSGLMPRPAYPPFWERTIQPWSACTSRTPAIGLSGA